MSYSPGGDAVGQNPSIIFKQLYSKAKHRQETVKSIDGLSIDNVLYKANAADHCYYLFYNEVVKEFLLQGYSEQKAEKHIKQWIDYDLVSVAYRDGYKLLSLSLDRGVV